MADIIQKTDSLNDGRVKLNEAIKDADTAKVTSKGAEAKSAEALAKSKSTQTQLDTIVIAGDSSVEAAQARVDTKGHPYATLKHRMDAEQTAVTTQLTQTEAKINIRSQGYSNKPIISFLFDDGRKTDVTRFKPIFDSEGVVGNICVITSQVGNSVSLTESELIELHNSGWTVASHTVTHPRLAEISLTQAEVELRDSQVYMKNLGLDYDIFVYPYGNYNSEVLRLTRKYYDYAVDIDRNFDNLPTNFRNMRISRTAGLSQPNATLASCKAYVDKVLETGGWLIFEDHSHYAFYDSQANLDLLKELIRYVKSKNVEVVSLREGINRKANIVEIQDELKDQHFKVNSNGQVVSNSLPIVFGTISSDSQIMNDSPIYDYPGKTLSEYRISNDEAIARGFPGAGVIKTHRHDSDYYSYQLFDMYRENKGYRRFWNEGAKNWSGWEIVFDTLRSETYSLGSITSTSKYSNNSPIQEFPINTVTEYRVDANASSSKGFPSGEAGFLTTHRHGSDFYAFQTYDIYKKNKRYRRNWDEGLKAWQPWKIIYDIA